MWMERRRQTEQPKISASIPLFQSPLRMLRGRRESLARLVGKRRRFLPNRESLLSSLPIQSSLNLLADEAGKSTKSSIGFVMAVCSDDKNKVESFGGREERSDVNEEIISADSSEPKVLGFLPRVLAQYLSLLIEKYYRLSFGGQDTAVPKDSLGVVPVQIFCHKAVSDENKENKNLEVFRHLWRMLSRIIQLRFR